jgi:hypothetical protein
MPDPFDFKKNNPAGEPASETLEPATIDWLEALPADVCPAVLAERYPRIANKLCVLWRRVARCEEFLDDLLVDRRGGRTGFPLEIVQELTALRDYYARLHPRPGTTWDVSI